MYSITENIYYSQLSSVAILLQPELISHRIIQGKDCVLSPYVLSSCGLPPTCLLVTVNVARSYFASTMLMCSTTRGVYTQRDAYTVACICRMTSYCSGITRAVCREHSPSTHMVSLRCWLPTYVHNTNATGCITSHYF
jgi:hypothetical protein